MRKEKIPFRRAVEVLRDKAGLAPLPMARGAEVVLPLDLDDQELLARVAGFYHQTLKQSPEALAYLAKRAESPEAIATFRLGFRQPDAGVPCAREDPAGRRRAPRAAAAARVLRESGHEHLSGSLTVPVFDEAGRVRQIYGRKITPDFRLRKGTPLHLYLPGPCAASGTSRRWRPPGK